MRFIGCKTLLLENIKEVIDRKAPNAKSFCDIFSGTATVARYFKQWYMIYSNDLLYFSFILQMGTLENDSIPKFNKLNKAIGISDPIDFFNSLKKKDIEALPLKSRFFQNTYSPIGGRMYLQEENALRIDYARLKTEEWYKNNLLTDNEYYYLVACIIEGIPFVSNISGTYGAFHKNWECRSYKKYEVCRLDVFTNNKKNRCFNLDGVELLKEISGDILYIDPPYNKRQYLPNYHVLETAAKYDYPIIKGVTAQRPYENKKSDFCQKNKALIAFENLIKNAKFEHIILSYSTEGIMALEDIEAVMKRYGIPESFEIVWIPYRRYKSREQNEKVELKEMIVYVKKDWRTNEIC